MDLYAAMDCNFKKCCVDETIEFGLNVFRHECLGRTVVISPIGLSVVRHWVSGSNQHKCLPPNNYFSQYCFKINKGTEEMNFSTKSGYQMIEFTLKGTRYIDEVISWMNIAIKRPIDRSLVLNYEMIQFCRCEIRIKSMVKGRLYSDFYGIKPIQVYYNYISVVIDYNQDYKAVRLQTYDSDVDLILIHSQDLELIQDNKLRDIEKSMVTTEVPCLIPSVFVDTYHVINSLSSTIQLNQTSIQFSPNVLNYKGMNKWGSKAKLWFNSPFFFYTRNRNDGNIQVMGYVNGDVGIGTDEFVRNK